MRKIFSLLILLGCSQHGNAGFSDYFSETRLNPEQYSRFNIGAGVTQQIVHVNLEHVTPHGIAYGKLGAFVNADHDLAAQAGLHIPVALNGKDLNGFYMGLFAGHLKSTSTETYDKTQIGGGVDLAYVMLNQDRISTLSVGIKAGEKVTHEKQVVFRSKPELQFAYSLSIGF